MQHRPTMCLRPMLLRPTLDRPGSAALRRWLLGMLAQLLPAHHGLAAMELAHSPLPR